MTMLSISRSLPWPWLWAVVLVLFPGACRGQAAAAALDAWLKAQTQVQTWTADFVQTRKLKSLAQPLTAHGKVWFAAPDSFRWQIEPDKTIAVKSGDELKIFYPQLKRVERMTFGGGAGPWRETLALLEAGFPRSQAQLEAKFQIVRQAAKGENYELVLRPRSAAARKLMPQMSIEFNPKDLVLTATELTFADGSTMRNDFQNQRLNSPVDQALLDPPIPPDYKVEEPLKPRR